MAKCLLSNLAARRSLNKQLLWQPQIRCRFGFANRQHLELTRNKRCTFSKKSFNYGAPQFGFVFDIDGVLLRSNEAIPGAREALTLLRQRKIPFMLLTNGGGKLEQDRIAEVNSKLELEQPISIHEFIQSHTPFQELVQAYRNSTILVVGGDDDVCRNVAESYGFKNVVVPGDLLCAKPDLWPFSRHLVPHYKRFARALPSPLLGTTNDTNPLKFSAIFVFNDPRDWGLDATIMADILMAEGGILGLKRSSVQDMNSHAQMPRLYWSNPDVLWAARYHLPRIGQGGFRAAFWGLLESMDAAYGQSPTFKQSSEILYGKPNVISMQYCEDRILNLHHQTHGSSNAQLRHIYMIGDNPASDIDGANRQAKSSASATWFGILVQTGVYAGENLVEAKMPSQVTSNVHEAVKWALAQEEQ